MTKERELTILIQRLLMAQIHATKITTIARKTGLNQQTVSRILYGETMYPRANTLFALAEYLKIDIQFHAPALVSVTKETRYEETHASLS